MPAQASLPVLDDGDSDHLVGHIAIDHDPVADVDRVGQSLQWHEWAADRSGLDTVDQADHLLEPSQLAGELLHQLGSRPGGSAPKGDRSVHITMADGVPA
jgi:hypothetical protein